MTTYVIAEIGSNHDGDYHQATDLIDEAHDAGANAAKFQCLPSLPSEWLPDLMEYGRELGIDVFATPFDVDAVHRLAELDVPYLKIASVEMVREDLIAAAAETEIPLLISTGMADIDEIRETLNCIDRNSRYRTNDITLLQCTTRYPTPVSQVNLLAMTELHEEFEIPVGLSDHSTSIIVPAAAVALGATVVEKHITLNRTLRGPDHPFALEPHEFQQMVEGIREVEQALGDGRKDGPVPGEMLELRGRRLQWTT